MSDKRWSSSYLWTGFSRWNDPLGSLYFVALCSNFFYIDLHKNQIHLPNLINSKMIQREKCSFSYLLTDFFCLNDLLSINCSLSLCWLLDWPKWKSNALTQFYYFQDVSRVRNATFLLVNRIFLSKYAKISVSEKISGPIKLCFSRTESTDLLLC